MALCFSAERIHPFEAHSLPAAALGSPQGNQPEKEQLLTTGKYRLTVTPCHRNPDFLAPRMVNSLGRPLKMCMIVTNPKEPGLSPVPCALYTLYPESLKPCGFPYQCHLQLSNPNGHWHTSPLLSLSAPLGRKFCKHLCHI